MPATIRYTTLRLLMVLVVGAVCYVMGARGLLLIILAFVISLPISFVVLARFRHTMIDEFPAEKVQKLNVVKAVSDRIDAAADNEDAILDRAEGISPDQPVDRKVERTADGGSEDAGPR